jgi:UDP-glucose 4-epimerase
MKNHGLIFHLAANPDARLGNQDTTLDLKQETIVTYNVLESMRMNDIKKIIFSSSGTIYGETPVIPLDEDYGPVLPISLYGAGKLASEGLISAFCHTFDMQAWIFRFANIVGSRATHGVIFDLLNKLKINPLELEILGDGNQCKPYMHVSDCISGMIYGFMNSNMRVNVHNLGPDTVSTVSAIAEAIVQQYGGKNVRFKYTGGDRGWPGDIPQVRYDNTKMKRSGWQASMTSAEAIKLAITEIIAGLQ